MKIALYSVQIRKWYCEYIYENNLSLCMKYSLVLYRNIISDKE